VEVTGKDPAARQSCVPSPRQPAAPWREPAAALALFSLLSALFTYPLAFHLTGAVEDGQDALLNVWILAWDGHALLSDPLRLFDANIFYPFSRALAYSEINLSQALLALPPTLISGNPVLGYNLALLLTFVLSGWGMYLLARRLTGNPWAGIGAGIVFAFNAYKLSNLAQIQLLSLHWLPFALLFLDRLLHPMGQASGRSLRAFCRSSGGDVLAVAVFLALQALASFYYALFAALAVGLFVLCRFSADRRLITRDNLARLGLAGGLAVAVVLPFAVPYFQVQSEMGFARTLAESEPFSASLRLYAEALPNNLLYGRWLAPASPVVIGGYPLDSLFPGFAALVAAAAGAVLALRVWRASLFYLLLVPLSFVLSLGPRLYLAPGQALDLPFSLPYAWLYAIVPGFQALRAPERFCVLGFLGLAVLVAYALAAWGGGGGRPGPRPPPAWRCLARNVSPSRQPRSTPCPRETPFRRCTAGSPLSRLPPSWSCPSVTATPRAPWATSTSLPTTGSARPTGTAASSRPSTARWSMRWPASPRNGPWLCCAATAFNMQSSTATSGRRLSLLPCPAFAWFRPSEATASTKSSPSIPGQSSPCSATCRPRPRPVSPMWPGSLYPVSRAPRWLCCPRTVRQ
jgi:hypothetical protein